MTFAVFAPVSTGDTDIDEANDLLSACADRLGLSP